MHLCESGAELKLSAIVTERSLGATGDRTFAKGDGGQNVREGTFAKGDGGENVREGTFAKGDGGQNVREGMFAKGDLQGHRTVDHLHLCPLWSRSFNGLTTVARFGRNLR